MNKRFLTLLLLIFPFIIFSNNVLGQYKISKVVIDAGHGGKDPGAVGKVNQEKAITLDVSLRLGELIKQRSNGKIQVIYTRTSDYYPSLKERHKIANDNNADLFISIHVNATASKTTTAEGTETYVLGLHRMDQKEDAIANYSENRREETGLLDMNDPTTAIIITQYSQRYLSKSVNFATKVQKNFSTLGRADLGVKQKGLEVLAGSAMPGVLIELGFINNSEEEIFLSTEAGAQAMAQSICNAVMEYATPNQNP